MRKQQRIIKRLERKNYRLIAKLKRKREWCAPTFGYGFKYMRALDEEILALERLQKYYGLCLEALELLQTPQTF